MEEEEERTKRREEKGREGRKEKEHRDLDQLITLSGIFLPAAVPNWPE